ncbi:MAG TPA: Rha family transcriptional regulator [Bacteriovoracaceae bacterium]|nr:Rha family transcriptional regulator [Bacteriovoracaceae bacterium]
MADKFPLERPFELKPPRLKDLVNRYVMGDVWLRDSPFGPVTDSLTISERFNLKHSNVLRAINKCRSELSSNSNYGLEDNLIESSYLAGAQGRERNERKVDITEFGLVLLLLYINSPQARQISAEILYRFFVLKTYVLGLNERQVGAIKGYYRKQIE